MSKPAAANHPDPAEVARAIRAEIEEAQANDGSATWGAVTTLVRRFGGTNLTESRRDVIDAALRGAGIEAIPPIQSQDQSRAQRHHTIRLRVAPTSVPSPAHARPILPNEAWGATITTERSLDWLGPTTEGVALIKLEVADLDEGSPVHQELVHSLGLREVQDLVRNLTVADELPDFEVQTIEWPTERVHIPAAPGGSSGRTLFHLSTFAVTTHESDPEGDRSPLGSGRCVRIDPVEFLIGPRWVLATAPRVGMDTPGIRLAFQAAGQHWRDLPAAQRDPLVLVLLVIRELAERYTDEVRNISAWLDDWNLQNMSALISAREQPRTAALHEISAALTRFRQSILAMESVVTSMQKDSLLNQRDPEVKSQVDNLLRTIDQDVEYCDRLLVSAGDSLRGCLQLAAAKTMANTQIAIEESQKQSESTLKAFEITAAVLAGPTLLVGLFGANTWQPIGDTADPVGFLVMLVLVVLSAVLAWLGIRLFTQHGRSDAKPKVVPHELAESPAGPHHRRLNAPGVGRHRQIAPV